MLPPNTLWRALKVLSEADRFSRATCWLLISAACAAMVVLCAASCDACVPSSVLRLAVSTASDAMAPDRPTCPALALVVALTSAAVARSCSVSTLAASDASVTGITASALLAREASTATAVETVVSAAMARLASLVTDLEIDDSTVTAREDSCPTVIAKLASADWARDRSRMGTDAVTAMLPSTAMARSLSASTL